MTCEKRYAISDEGREDAFGSYKLIRKGYFQADGRFQSRGLDGNGYGFIWNYAFPVDEEGNEIKEKCLAPCEKLGYEVDDMFLYVGDTGYFKHREQIRLDRDDHTDAPYFRGAGGHGYYVSLEDVVRYPNTTSVSVEVEEHPMYPILMQVIEQAMYGKGERHGGCVTPFLDQPWKHYAEMHGRGFLTGQAAKKLEEAASLREGEAFNTEVFGAIAYLAMAVLNENSTLED